MSSVQISDAEVENRSESAIGGWVLWLLAIAMMLLMTGRMVMALHRDSRLSHESGVFTAMAMDFAHGVLYRPLLGPDGYGGTRYFPLQVVLHGSLIRLGVSPIPAGYVVLISSLILLLVGFYATLRNLGISAASAIQTIMICSGTASAGMAVTMIRGDLLPAALNLLGLALVTWHRKAAVSNPEPEVPGGQLPMAGVNLVLAGIVFGLAFLTKVTTVFGIASAVIALVCARKTLHAVVTVFFAGIVAVSGLIFFQHLSHGNFLLNLKTCAGGGGGIRVLQGLPDNISTVFVHNDPIGLVLLFAGMFAFVMVPATLKRSLPRILFVVTGMVTLSMFVTPGIAKNHLLDLQLSAAILFAVCAASGPLNLKRLGQFTIAAMLVFELLCGWVDFHGDLSEHVDVYRKVWREATNGSQDPVLTDFTLLPVLFNQRPVLLDDFMLPAIHAHSPEIWNDIYSRIDRRIFSAIILKADPLRPDRKRDWGLGLTTHMEGKYSLASSSDGFLVYRRLGDR